ncbi:MAG TPA: exodeoxyribonuclease VII large subunit [Phycisphaerae bacterium]|nr:exodeoxyribonuclease VII large subunit [Phycisphaerae bacterium]
MGAEPRHSEPMGRLGPPLLSVSAVTAMVKSALAEHLPGTLHVVGQISNFKRHSSGHLYLTLKDDASELACVMWRSAAAKLAFSPTDGLEVIATGYVDVFDRAGRYQLYVRKLEPRGVGALELAFRQLRDKLSSEGLFDTQHKKPLPPHPERIAVVTSPTGAAVRDILQTLERRYACAAVLLYPVAVQGPTAAEQIAAAIASLNRRREALGGIDVMIVGRGGGSLEDLWAFNEEAVARAIFASRIPVISAVGHEVDVTIADLVADVRAATPTAAAELAVPDAEELLLTIDRHGALLGRVMRHRFELGRADLAGLLRRKTFADPLAPVHQRELVIDELCSRMPRALLHRIHRSHRRIRHCDGMLQRIQPQTYLLRLERELARRQQRLSQAMSQRLTSGERRLAGAVAALSSVRPAPRLERSRDRLAHVQRRLAEGIRHRFSTLRVRLAGETARLSALSYRSTLNRGFTITRTKRGRRVVRSVKEVADGTRLLTETTDGEFESEVVNLRQLELFE